MSAAKKFQPSLMLFSCNWCFPFSPEEESRIPEGTGLMRTLCTGRIHPSYILEAFSSGADGVFIAACAEGECHYETGNVTIQASAKRARDLLHLLGVDPGRFELRFFHPGRAAEVLEALGEFRERITGLGPAELGPLDIELEEVKA